MEANLGIT